MMSRDFENVYYLKLGKEGAWEDNLINGNKARIGWRNIELQDIQDDNWDKIKKDIENDFKIRNKKSGATQDFNALEIFCQATDNDIFITFSKGMLFWCVLDNTILQQDNVSKFRTLKDNWTNTDINGKVLYLNNITGKITKTQGFRATLCKIKEKNALKRLINSELKPIVSEIKANKKELQDLLVKSFSELYWKDCEILTDLIFNNSGWRRISMLGESMKFMDIDLENPITKERYQVQVKASAGKKEFEDYANEFDGLGYSRLFFVTFNPKSSLIDYKNNYKRVELLKDNKLAELIIDLGLTNWVINRLT